MDEDRPIDSPAPRATPASPVVSPPTAAPILCASCRYDISDRPVGGVCPECGTPIMQRAGPQQTQGKAVASLVLGICSIAYFLVFGVYIIVMIVANGW